MGKIIQATITALSCNNVPYAFKTKIGHVIGIRDKKILCEELDSNYDFVIENGKKKVFACNPESVEQIGYLTPEEIMLKR